MSGQVDSDVVDLESHPETFAKLAPGPGRSADEVAAHQTARIRAAMVEIVAAEGYEAVTVRKLTKLAGVSARAFYKNYTGTQECFLDTFDRGVRGLARKIVAAARDERIWEQRLRASLLAFTSGLAENPKTARLLLIEVHSAGATGVGRIRHIFALLEAIVRDGFEHRRGTEMTESLLVKGVVAGVIGVAQARVIEGRESELPGLSGELADWALCLRAVETDALAKIARSVGATHLPPRDEGAVWARVPNEDRNRALILAAVEKLARSEHLADISPRLIRNTSGVSLRALGQAFPGSRDSLLAALEDLVRKATRRAREAGCTAPSWSRGITRAICSFCREVACDPSLARLAFAEASTLGPEAVRHRMSVTATIRKQICAAAPADSRLTGLAAEASVGGAWTVLQNQAAAGEAEFLLRVGPSLAMMVLAPDLGAASALIEIRREVEAPVPVLA